MDPLQELCKKLAKDEPLDEWLRVHCASGSLEELWQSSRRGNLLAELGESVASPRTRLQGICSCIRATLPPGLPEEPSILGAIAAIENWVVQEADESVMKAAVAQVDEAARRIDANRARLMSSNTK